MTGQTLADGIRQIKLLKPTLAQACSNITTDRPSTLCDFFSIERRMVAKPMTKTARIPGMKAHVASQHEYSNNVPRRVKRELNSLPDTAT